MIIFLSLRESKLHKSKGLILLITSGYQQAEQK
jgi:hypothetical protein